MTPDQGPNDLLVNHMKQYLLELLKVKVQDKYLQVLNDIQENWTKTKGTSDLLKSQSRKFDQNQAVKDPIVTRNSIISKM